VLHDMYTLWTMYILYMPSKSFNLPDPGHLMQPVVRFRNPEHTIDQTKPRRPTRFLGAFCC